MEKSILSISLLLILLQEIFASCGGQKKANAQEEPSKVALSYSKSLKAPGN